VGLHGCTALSSFWSGSMRKIVVLTVAAAVAVGLFFALRPAPSAPPLPFYLANPDALRRLPQEDLLRMRDNILEVAAAKPDRPITEPLPAGATATMRGSLFAASGHRSVSGTVRILRMPDNRLVARLEDFRVANAPDLHLYLLGEQPAETDPGSDLSRPMNAGPLGGNAGSQNFPLPAGTDAARLRRAVIRCDLFGVTFSEAELKPDRAR
jgi:hypothetical protein